MSGYDRVTYCDVVESCNTCQRYGDDCGGDKRNDDPISPSAEANPTVIRCKTMIPYGDFREWAKRIKEENPNVIVIPCDAEVASAEAVQGWIPCSKKMPDEDGEYLVTFNGKFIDNIIKVMFYEVEKKCFSLYFPGAGDITFQEVRAWMPLPEPYKEDDNEN